MVFVFPDHAILAGWCGKAGFARGNGRFADQRLALEEISALFPDIDNDSGRAGDVIAVPSIRHGSRHRRGRDRAGRSREFGAAGQEGQDGKGDRASKQAHAAHKDAQSNAFHWRFNTKHRGGNETLWIGLAGTWRISVRLFLPRDAVPDSLSGGGTIVHMHPRLIAILGILCFAFGGAGCESLFKPSKPKSSKKKRQKEYQLVVMPLQTGSTLQRRAFIEMEPESEPKKKSKKKESPSPTPKPETEPSETPPPPPEETPAPTPERFR